MIRKLAIILLSASMLSTVSFAADSNDKVVATFNGGEIKESQVMQEFKQELDLNEITKGKKFSELDENIQKNLVRSILNNQLIDNDAKDKKIADTAAFKEKLSKELAQIEKTKEELPKLLAREEVLQSQIKDATSDKNVDAAYDKYVASLKGKDDIKVSHILVNTEEAAKDIKRKLNKGAKFAALAKEFSKDDATKNSGGELRLGDPDGFVRRGSISPEFEDKTVAMKVNEVSDPVKTQFGWHIIKLLGKRPAKIPTKDEVKGQIIMGITSAVIKKYVEDLNSKANVKFNIIAKDAPAPVKAK